MAASQSMSSASGQRVWPRAMLGLMAPPFSHMGLGGPVFIPRAVTHKQQQGQGDNWRRSHTRRGPRGGQSRCIGLRSTSRQRWVSEVGTAQPDRMEHPWRLLQIRWSGKAWSGGAPDCLSSACVVHIVGRWAGGQGRRNDLLSVG